MDWCPLTTPLASPMIQRPLPPPPTPTPTPTPVRPPDTIPTFITPLLLPPCPCMGTCHCSLNENAPYYCHESLGDLPLPYLSRRLLDVGIGYAPYDAINEITTSSPSHTHTHTKHTKHTYTHLLSLPLTPELPLHPPLAPANS